MQRTTTADVERVFHAAIQTATNWLDQHAAEEGETRRRRIEEALVALRAAHASYCHPWTLPIPSPEEPDGQETRQSAYLNLGQFGVDEPAERVAVAWSELPRPEYV